MTSYKITVVSNESVELLSSNQPTNKHNKKEHNNEKIAMDNYVTSAYPESVLLRTATKNYNCHSYAWFSTSSYNTFWINDPGLYMTDGSYSQASQCSVDDKVYYGASENEHSGIVYSIGTRPIAPNAYNIIEVTSKWGAYGLVRHPAQECPYYESGLELEFYN